MAKHHVTCINKPEHYNRHEHITHIGNSAEKWRITREDAIKRIDSGTDSFYTIDKTTGKECQILVVREQHGKDPYLRSHADGKPNDNLLEQEDCSEACVVGNLGGGLAGHKPHSPVDLRGGGRHG
jgi:hypothetical protein